MSRSEPGRGKKRVQRVSGKCKGPEAGTVLEASRKNQKTSTRRLNAVTGSHIKFN